MGLDMYLNKTRKKEGMSDMQVIKDEDIWKESEEIAYWRKANQIHNWFYKNCAKEDQEDYENLLVTKADLEALLETAKEVKASINLINGKVDGGSTYNAETGCMETIWIDGKTIEDDTLCRELLPTVRGFFFGSTDYDEFYVEDIDNTIKQLERILNEEEVDWENEVVYYSASY